MGYDLGVDLGGTTVAAAVLRDGEAGAEAVPLGPDGSPTMPAAAHRGTDGVVRIGDDAEHRAIAEPDGLVRDVTTRLGDDVPLVVAGEPWRADDVAAEVVLAAVRRVAGREHGPARALAVTHPAGWGPHRERTLRRALVRVGLGHAVLVSEPRAAVLAASVLGGLRPGRVAGVFDLGGRAFHAAVVRRGERGSRTGTEALADTGGPARAGGLDVDAAVLAHVHAEVGDALESAIAALPDDRARAALATLRATARTAKERLSADTETTVDVDLPGLRRTVRMTRADLEARITPLVSATVDSFATMIDEAGVGVDQVLLVGGSARIPLVARLLAEELGRPVHPVLDPGTIVAQGAALAAAEHAVALRHGPPSPRPTTTWTAGPPSTATASGGPAIPGPRPPSAGSSPARPGAVSTARPVAMSAARPGAASSSRPGAASSSRPTSPSSVRPTPSPVPRGEAPAAPAAGPRPRTGAFAAVAAGVALGASAARSVRRASRTGTPSPRPRSRTSSPSTSGTAAEGPAGDPADPATAGPDPGTSATTLPTTAPGALLIPDAGARGGTSRTPGSTVLLDRRDDTDEGGTTGEWDPADEWDLAEGRDRAGTDVPRPPVNTAAAPIGSRAPQSTWQRHRAWILAVLVLVVVGAAVATVPVPGLTSLVGDRTPVAPPATSAVPAPAAAPAEPSADPTTAAPPPTTAASSSPRGSEDATTTARSSTRSRSTAASTTTRAAAARTSGARATGAAATGRAAGPVAAAPAGVAPVAAPAAAAPAVAGTPVASSEAPSSSAPAGVAS